MAGNSKPEAFSFGLYFRVSGATRLDRRQDQRISHPFILTPAPRA
jgi:hypothetical protein